MVAARDIPLSSLFRRLVLPLAAMLVLLGLQIGYYDWRVTGHPALMPHILNDQTYTIAPQFLFGTPRQEPNYGYPEIRRIYEGYLESFLSQRGSFGAVMRATANKIGILAQGYLWSFLMVVALLGLPWALARDPWLRGVLLIGLLFLVGQLATSWLFPHYAAPAAGLFFLLVISAMRSLYLWRGFSAGTARSGRNIVRGLAILFVISYCQIAARMRSEDTVQWFTERQALLDTLRNRPEKTLLFVKYDPNHNPNREWVYNDADIVHAKVILARDLGAQKNRELLDYFPDRNAWMVCADAPVPILQPYPGS